jgi:phosphopantothenoylcysteine synthetase/decarboxylase
MTADLGVVVPELGARRLVLLGTGALSVASMPLWVALLRHSYPALTTRLLLTRSAERLVSRAALEPVLGSAVGIDVWPDEPSTTALHAELNEWADMFVVYPATMGFVARLATGLADSPTLLAIQCTSAPVAVAPALPPGGVDSVTYRRHCASIKERANVVVVPPAPAFSATTGRFDAAGTGHVTTVLARAEELRRKIA